MQLCKPEREKEKEAKRIKKNFHTAQVATTIKRETQRSEATS